MRSCGKWNEMYFIASQLPISLLSSPISHCDVLAISLLASLYFIASQPIFHCLPPDISLLASQYFIVCQPIFHCQPDNISLPASQISLLASYISLLANPYFIVCQLYFIPSLAIGDQPWEIFPKKVTVEPYVRTLNIQKLY